MGVPPHIATDYTFAWIFILLEGMQVRNTREMQVALFGAWQTEHLARHKRLPNLATLLRKLEPVRVMSAKALRGAIVNMARAMGAKVTHVKRGQG